MQITRETDYAVRCVLFLSRSNEIVVMTDAIAAEMDVPKSFLAKILQKLVKADIVKSYRGAKGGVSLSKVPEKISLLDVVKAIEGDVAMNRCVFDPASCDFSSDCSVHPVWSELSKRVESYLKGTKFCDLKDKKTIVKKIKGDKHKYS